MSLNQFVIHCIFGCLLVAVAVCLCDEDNSEDEHHVSNECSHKLRQLDSIEKFETFMKHYKNLVRDKKKPKKGFLNLNSRLRKCYNIESPLLELENLVTLRHNNQVCQTQYIDQLVEFHFKYLTKEEENSSDKEADAKTSSEQKASRSGYSYLSYFFSLYAHQVAFTCKSKLIDRVRAAQHRNDCLSVLFQFMPSIFGSSEEDEETGDGQDLTEAEDFLREFKRVEHYAPIMNHQHSPSKLPEVYLDAVIPEAALEKINSLKEECRLREPSYSSLFAPIAMLAQLGYSVDESTSDSDNLQDADTRLLKCWLATAQLCQGILRTHLTVSKEQEQSADTKFVSIKWGSPPAGVETLQNLLTASKSGDQDLFNDSIDEISPHIISLVKKQFTNVGKIKRKALAKAKSFVERHINLDSMQKEASKNFLEALTNVDNGIDSKVSFCGKQFDNKKFNPVSIITDDADFAVQLSSSFWNKYIGLAMSSIIAITMSAVFVWFSLYAVASSLKQSYFSPKDDGNFKAKWRELRDQRVKSMESKLTKKGVSDLGKAYKPM